MTFLIQQNQINQGKTRYVKGAKVNCYKCSFFTRIVKEWNDLPKYIVEAETFNLFRSRLKSYMSI